MQAAITDRKKVIRDTARKLFQERGFAGTSMRHLADAVGIRAASLYNHVGTKEELLNEICFELAALFFERFKAATRQEKTYSKKMQAAIKAHVGVIVNHLDASKVFFEEWVFLKESDLVRFKKMRSQYERGFRELLENGIAKGEFKSVNVRLATFVILSALNAIHYLDKTNERMKSKVMEEEICNLLMKGLKK